MELLIAGSIDEGNNSCISKEEFRQIKLDKKIICLGHINNMKDLYENSDLVVLPSWREGLSKSLIEAASMECPIITTNVPGCKDIIENNVNGLLVTVRKPRELKKAIQKLLLKIIPWQLILVYQQEKRLKQNLKFQV